MNKKLNIVFMGNPDFAVPSLTEIHKEHKVSLVICSPDRPAGRGQKLRSPDVKLAAEKLGLEIFQPESPNSKESIEKIKSVNADLIVIVAFKILKKEVIAIPKLGAINLHASMLPKYRGAAPIQWAVANGDASTGCTVFFLNERIDEGSVLDQQEIEIGSQESAGELWERMKFNGAEFLADSINIIAKGNYKLKDQDDSKATKAPKLKKEDGKIDFSMDSREIFNLFRAFTPYPGIYGFLNGKKLQFTSLSADTNNSGKASGTIESVSKEGIRITCGKGSILVVEIKPENKKSMTVAAFLNGGDIPKDGRFE